MTDPSESYKQAYKDTLQNLPLEVVASLKTIHEYCSKQGCDRCNLVYFCDIPFKWYGRRIKIGEGKE